METNDDINAKEQGQKKRLSGIKLFFLVIGDCGCYINSDGLVKHIIFFPQAV